MTSKNIPRLSISVSSSTACGFTNAESGFLAETAESVISPESAADALVHHRETVVRPDNPRLRQAEARFWRLAACKPRILPFMQFGQIRQAVYRQLLNIALAGRRKAFNIPANSLP